MNRQFDASLMCFYEKHREEKTQTAFIDEDAVKSFIVCLGSAFLVFMDINLFSNNCIL